MEPPSHDAWEPERNEEDPRSAKEAINALRVWLRKCVQELYPEVDAGSIEIPDLERYLPDDEDDEPLDTSRGESEGEAVPPDERILEGKFRRPTQPSAASGVDEGIGDQDGELGGDEESTEDGGDRGSKGGPTQGETEINVPLRIFMDPTSESRYLIHGELPGSGRYAIYLYAFGDDGKRDAIELERPRVKKNGDKWVAVPRKTTNAIGPIEAEGREALQIEFKVPSKLRLTVSSKVTKYAD
jgi:hypothetical protein